ncbi:Heterokaryon incompatibility protein (HET) domain containing protein [Rhypophila decipiens]
MDEFKRENKESTLQSAVERGDFKKIKLLLDLEISKVLDPHSVDPDASIYMGRTALSLAAGSGEIGVVRHLLANDKVDPTSRDNKGRTPLHWALETKKNHIELVKALFEVYNVRKLDWELADSYGYTPLDKAIRYFQASWRWDILRERVFKLFFEQDAGSPLAAPWCRYCLRLMAWSTTTGFLHIPETGLRVMKCLRWSLMEAASSRCEMCRYLHKQVQTILQGQPPTHARIELVRSECKSFTIQVIVPRSPVDICRSSAASLAFYGLKDQPEGGRMIHEDNNPTTTFEESISVIHKWLEECTGQRRAGEHDHGLCPSGEGLLPKRLLRLDFNNTDQLQLIECAEGQAGRYAALSHCWGNPRDMEQIKTTTRNYKQHLSSIVYSELPKSFQDAVQVCRELGLQNLWIDSLCIVQDDSNDWQHESTNMTDTYENAFITLAATASAGCTEGFTFSYQRPQHFSEFSVYPGPDLGQLRKQPLYKRGWTLQEMVLSRRLVHFGHDQLYWFCRSSTKGQYGQSLGLDTALPALKSRPTEQDHDLWWDWVEDYSRRQLTRREDKFPALAGLTNKFQQLTGGNHALGLWMEDIHYGLLWRADKASHGLPPSHSVAGVDKPFYIPSWSWASFQSPINRASGFKREFVRPQAIIRPNSLEVCWEGEDLTSSLLVGSLYIKGRLKMFKVLEAALMDLRFDKGSFSTDPAGVWCLEILQTCTPYRWLSTHFLLLEKEIQDSSTSPFPKFSRIGIGICRAEVFEHWFGDSPMEDVILV